MVGWYLKESINKFLVGLAKFNDNRLFWELINPPITDLPKRLVDLPKTFVTRKSFTVSEISDFEIVNTALGKKFCRYKGCVNLSEKF